MMHYITANTVIELICFLFAIICLKNDSSLVWRSMIVYLFITCAAELSGIYVELKHNNNQWVYNIFIIAEAGFTNLMFAYLYKQFNKGKYIVTVGVVLFVSLYTYDLVTHGFMVYSYLTYKSMSVLYVTYSLYFYYLLLKDERYISIARSAIFWWVAGALFFYFGNTMCDLFDDLLSDVKIFKNEDLTYFVFKILNIILYGCWSYSFVCRKWLTLK
jgi:hypothetical protein